MEIDVIYMNDRVNLYKSIRQGLSAHYEMLIFKVLTSNKNRYLFYQSRKMLWTSIKE